MRGKQTLRKKGDRSNRPPLCRSGLFSRGDSPVPSRLQLSQCLWCKLPDKELFVAIERQFVRRDILVHETGIQQKDRIDRLHVTLQALGYKCFQERFLFGKSAHFAVFANGNSLAHFRHKLGLEILPSLWTSQGIARHSWLELTS